MEKEYFIDFTGWFKIKVKNEEEAQKKFLELVSAIRKNVDFGPDDQWSLNNLEEV